MGNFVESDTFGAQGVSLGNVGGNLAELTRMQFAELYPTAVHPSVLGRYVEVVPPTEYPDAFTEMLAGSALSHTFEPIDEAQ